MITFSKDAEEGVPRELPSGLELVRGQQDFIYRMNTGTETVTERHF